MERSKLKGMVFAALFAALTGAVAWFKIPLPFTPVPITLQTLMVLLSGSMLGPVYGALSMIVYLLLGTIGLPVFAGGSSGVAALLGPTGGYLFSYPVAAFVIGYMLQKKKLNAFVRYFSFTIILALTAVIAIDSVFKIGIMKLWDNASSSYVPMVDLISQQQRLMLIIFSLAVFIGMVLLVFYLKKSKSISFDAALAMFAGTLIIYVMGSVQGKLVTGLPWSAVFVGWVLPFIIGDTLKLLAAAWIAKNIGIGKYMK
ncbi:biotin transporter BioY [Candidatus Woesearchaeota archaeon]|nr:biotin transporter BioY [Candidatus Woesearchaeota archaeon]